MKVSVLQFVDFVPDLLRQILESFANGSRFVSSVPFGLVNAGNNCYLNSALQIVFSTGPLIYFIMTSHQSSTCFLNGDKFCSLCAIQRLLKSRLTDRYVSAPFQHQPQLASAFFNNLRGMFTYKARIVTSFRIW